MAQAFWDWLRYNSVQLQTLGSLAQALGSVAAVLVAMLLGFVAWRQARAADAQASAANTQAEAAKTQISTSLFIADKQVSPNFSITAAVRGGIIVRNSIAILNNGFGSAREVKLSYRDSMPNPEIVLGNSTLVVRDSIGVSIDEDRARNSGLTLTYSTVFGTKYALDFEWDATASRPINEKIRVLHSQFKIPTEELTETR